jgi:hypothetical protein
MVFLGIKTNRRCKITNRENTEINLTERKFLEERQKGGKK